MVNDEPKGSFTHWQSTTIVQLTYAINLILSFSVAVLGFQIAIILNEKFNPVSWQKCTFLFSLACLLISVGSGILCVINRLRDFRATMKVAQMREKGRNDEEIQPYRALYQKLGAMTWRLFWWQIGTFGVGVLVLVLSIAVSLRNKLF
jgi:uncharacterized membrane protein YbhN (UPF0104 family)